MNTTEAQRMLREELDKHGLYHVTTKMNGRLTTVFGRYRYNRLGHKSIELSTKLVEINDAERVRLTILHEVAHALTEGHGHDRVWKAKLLELGGDGKRCYSSSDTNTIERRRRKWQGYCDEHGVTGIYYQRRERACGTCCNKYNSGRYHDDYRIQYMEL